MVLIAVSSIDHNDTDRELLYGDACFDDHPSHCRPFGVDPLFDLEMVCSILGEQFGSLSSFLLKIPECIDLFIGEVPDDIVRWERLVFHELRDTVICCGESCFEVELMLCF